MHSSKNGTFLFARDYMEYHSEKFEDHSLIIRKGGTIFALMPANRVDDELHSHQGLTYGGLVTTSSMTTPRMVQIFKTLVKYLHGLGFRRLHYKTVPYIYHRIPAGEDLYVLFHAGAPLTRRDVLSVIPLGRRAPVQARRRRGAAKAQKHRLVVGETGDWRNYWKLLSDRLQDRYDVQPVHSIQQIELLRGRFLENIRLFEARLLDEVLAGVVIFESAMVAHVQYVASSARGRDAGALDRIFEYLIEQVFREKPFFDFGSSNEQQGRFLNIGLIEQKEGFGARAIVHDFYTLELNDPTY